MARRKYPSSRRDPRIDPYHVKIRRLLDAKRQGRTDEEIAAAAGMSPSQFSQLTGGWIKDPRLSTILKLLHGIGATLSDYDEV